MKFLTCICIVPVVTLYWTAADVAPPAYRNIGFLGRGYDIFRSDPRPISQPAIDRAILEPIFDVSTYSQNRLSADQTGRLPDAAYAVDCTSCMAAFEANTIRSAEDFRSVINSQVETGFGMGITYGKREEKTILGFKHSASQSYLQTSAETSNASQVAVDVSTSCVVYCADLRIIGSEDTSPLEQPFLRAVQRLPVEDVDSNEAALGLYHQFVQRFGTHYIVSMKAGSLYWQRTLFSVTDFEKLEFEMEAEAESTAVQVLWFKFSDSRTYSNETTAMKMFKSRSASNSYYSIGMPPTGNGTVEEWLNSTKNRPMPVSVKLIPVSDLLNTEFFSSDGNIDKKRENFEKVFNQPQRYCRFLASRYSTVDCNDLDQNTATSQPKGVFGGVYYMSDFTSTVENVPNEYTRAFECPQSFTRLTWARMGNGNPGYLYACLADSWHHANSSDPEAAFGGFYYYADTDSSYYFSSNPVLGVGQTCPSDYSLVIVGQFQLVESSPKERVEIYACYRYQPGAALGGFFLKHATTSQFTHSNWVNPATGVASCPSGYTAQLLLSSKDSAFPFKSYYCSRE